MSIHSTRNLIISFVPEAHDGDPLLADIMLSDSYEDTIEAACRIWASRIPPANHILSRSLARKIQRSTGNAQQWVTLQPERFAAIVKEAQDSSDEIELRLEIQAIQVSSKSSVDTGKGSEWVSALGKFLTHRGDRLPAHKKSRCIIRRTVVFTEHEPWTTRWYM
ncbi:hypothetical protein RhiJN_11565 [Ceratobasidium sp. AG-Ba]|nr:hypothetical protein RhiJN_11565 [Ceratobasidium sp. AG-Ba]